MEDPQFHNILFTWVDVPYLCQFAGDSRNINNNPFGHGRGKGTDTPMNIADHGDIGWNQFD